MKIIVVGAGGTTRDLLGRLGDFWDVTVVDTDQTALEQAGQVRDIRKVAGDGSSRVLLERVGVSAADAFVAATNDDGVNLEACRIARDTGLVRVVARANDPDRIPAYRDLGVEAYSPAGLASHRIGRTLEAGSVLTTSFAGGLAEAIEVRVGEDSPVKGRRLRDLHSESWLVAAILRDGQLVLPRGDTMLRVGDLVTVVGAAADYPLMMRSFTLGEARFPTEWGKRIAVALEEAADLDGPVAAALRLTRNSSAESLLVVHRAPASIKDPSEQAALDDMLGRLSERAQGVRIRPKPVAVPPRRGFLDALAGENVGAVVLRPPGKGLAGLVQAVRLISRLRSLGRPALLPHGAQFGQIVVEVRDTPVHWPAVRAAVDLASYSRAELEGIAPIVPSYPGADDGSDAAVRAARRLGEEAGVSGILVRRHFARGSWMKVAEQAMQGPSLVVTTFPRFNPTLLNPGAVVRLLRNPDTSVLLIPRAGER